MIKMIILTSMKNKNKFPRHPEVGPLGHAPDEVRIKAVKQDSRVESLVQYDQDKFRLTLKYDYTFGIDNSSGQARRMFEGDFHVCVMMLNEATTLWADEIKWYQEKGFDLLEESDGTQSLKKKYDYPQVTNWQGVVDDVRIKSAEQRQGEHGAFWRCVPEEGFVTIGDHMKWSDWPQKFWSEESVFEWLNHDVVSWEKNTEIMCDQGGYSRAKDRKTGAPIVVWTRCYKKVRSWSDIEKDPRVKIADKLSTAGGMLYTITLVFGFVLRGALSKGYVETSFDCFSVKECCEAMNQEVIHWTQNVQEFRERGFYICTNGRTEYLKED